VQLLPAFQKLYPAQTSMQSLKLYVYACAILLALGWESGFVRLQ